MEIVQLPHMGYEENPQIKVLTDKLDLPKTKAQTVFDKFSDYLRQAAEIEKVIDQYVVTDMSQVENMEWMKKISKALQRIRIDAEATRKVEKADSLNEGRLVDGINNVILGLVAPMEAKANASAKFIEIAEQKKRDELRKAMVDALRPYTPDAEIMPVTDMTEEGFNQLLESMKAGHEKRLKDAQDLADQKKADDERLQLENEALKLLHIRTMSFLRFGAFEQNGIVCLKSLKGEMDLTIKLDELKGYNQETFDNCLYAFELYKKDNDEFTMAENKKKEKLRIETETKLKKEREEKQALQKAENERIANEVQAKRDEQNAKRRAARQPDREKALTLMITLADIRDKQLPKMSTPEGETIITDVKEMFNRMIIYIDKKVKNLDE